MKLLEFFCVAFLFEVCAIGDVSKTSYDVNRGCIVRFLQIKGKLKDNLQTSSAPANLCRILLPLIYANHSERLCLRLWETKSVKAECVFEMLKNSEFIDLELKFDIYSKQKRLAKSVRRKNLYEVSTRQREILTIAAKKCKSDSTYGGLFDEILGINSSIIVLQENDCLLKYAIENKFINAPGLTINVRNIDTSKIDCSLIITKCQEETEQKLLEAFQIRKYSPEAIACLLQKYQDDRIFGWNLAKDFLFKLIISDTIRKAEDWRISKILSDFNKKSSNCLYSLNRRLF